MTESAIAFDPEAHRYEFPGRRVPSVTQVLSDAGLVDYEFCSDFAMWRGSQVHAAIHIELTQGLDWQTVPESFHPFVSAARQYLDDHHAEIVEVERRVFSRLYGYAGTLDIVFREHGKCGCGARSSVVLADWKSGPPRPATALQVAAYAHAYFEETELYVNERRVVQLCADGDYKPIGYTNRDDRNRFLAAVTVANLRREYGLLKGEAA